MPQESGHVAEAPSLAVTFIAYKIVTIGTVVAPFIVLADASSTAVATLNALLAMFAEGTTATGAATVAMLAVFANGATAAVLAQSAFLAMGAFLDDARRHGRYAYLGEALVNLGH